MVAMLSPPLKPIRGLGSLSLFPAFPCEKTEFEKHAATSNIKKIGLVFITLILISLHFCYAGSRNMFYATGALLTNKSTNEVICYLYGMDNLQEIGNQKVTKKNRRATQVFITVG